MHIVKESWIHLSSRYTHNKALQETLWAELEQQYTRQNRHYHTLGHLAYMLRHAQDCKDLIYDFDTLLFSIFYHDIIYNPLRRDNEEKSAFIAEARMKQLKVPGGRIECCQKQILATQNHLENEDKDTAYLLDFDLAILGEAPDIYRDYTKNIRKEYRFVPPILYRNRRKKVLRHFLEMRHIFKTERFRKIFEKQARINLAAELATL